MNKPPPKLYRVVLKGGQWSDFPNNDKIEDYPACLQSGVYKILWHDGRYYPITPETIDRIEQIANDSETKNREIINYSRI